MPSDNYNRDIDYLRLSVTDKCNLGCIYCVPDGKPAPFDSSELMSQQEIVRLVRIALGFGVRKIRLTGGEPLIRGDIIELVRAIAQCDVRDLSLTTNGLALRELARPLKEAGLSRLNVSLDTMDPVRYRKITGGGELQDALAGLRAAEDAGLDPVKINMVPMRGINDDEIPAFARLALSRPVHIRFIEYMPTGGSGNWDRSRCVTSDEARQAVEDALGPLLRRHFRGKGPSRNYTLKGAPGIVGFISALSHSFCYRCNRLRITSRGRIRSCLFSKTEIDLLAPMRRGAGDAEISRLFLLAIQTKPEGNYLRSPEGAAIGPMSEIGG